MRRKVVVANNRLFEDVTKIVASGERVILLAKGGSMFPFIDGGRDSVELSRVDDEICRGDILLARVSSPTRYVIHRVIKIEDEKITLMGDGNIQGVEECRGEDVVARVTSIIKPHGSVDPNTKRARLYAKIWVALQPVRRYIFAIRRRLFRS